MLYLLMSQGSKTIHGQAQSLVGWARPRAWIQKDVNELGTLLQVSTTYLYHRFRVRLRITHEFIPVP
jgi:hypothetical protein